MVPTIAPMIETSPAIDMMNKAGVMMVATKTPETLPPHIKLSLGPVAVCARPS
jgi:hypothetical protein